MVSGNFRYVFLSILIIIGIGGFLNYSFAQQKTPVATLFTNRRSLEVRYPKSLDKKEVESMKNFLNRGVPAINSFPGIRFIPSDLPHNKDFTTCELTVYEGRRTTLTMMYDKTYRFVCRECGGREWFSWLSSQKSVNGREAGFIIFEHDRNEPRKVGHYINIENVIGGENGSGGGGGGGSGSGSGTGSGTGTGDGSGDGGLGDKLKAAEGLLSGGGKKTGVGLGETKDLEDILRRAKPAKVSAPVAEDDIVEDTSKQIENIVKEVEDKPKKEEKPKKEIITPDFETIPTKLELSKNAPPWAITLLSLSRRSPKLFEDFKKDHQVKFQHMDPKKYKDCETCSIINRIDEILMTEGVIKKPRK